MRTLVRVEDNTLKITSSGKEENTFVTQPEITLYPNPTSSLLNVTSVSDKATFRVYSLVGQNVLNGRITNQSIDVTSLPAGNYIIEILDSETTTSKRFIKQ